MAAVKAGIVPPSLAGDMPPAPPVVKRTPDVSSSPSAVGNSSQAGRVDGKKAGAGIDLEDLPDEIDEETIKQILDQADEVHVEILSESNLKRCVAQLEKRIKKNQQDRIRYAEDPEKWIKSEVDLDEEIKRWKNLAADPSLYPLFIETRGLELLLSLLNHSNQDIQLEVFDVLTELTDTDTISECEKPQEILNKLVEHQVPELTVEGLLRINEDAGEDEHRGVSHCLSIIENLLELDPSLSTKFSKLPRFASWLLRRIRTSPLGGQTAPTAAGGGGAVSSSFDFNRVYASELLVIILQNSHEARETLGMKQSGDAVDKILRAVASYRKRDPESSQEEEMIQNLFDALCSLLLVRSNQELLGRQQGIELMLRIIKERRRPKAEHSALLSLSHRRSSHGRLQISSLNLVYIYVCIDIYICLSSSLSFSSFLRLVPFLKQSSLAWHRPQKMVGRRCVLFVSPFLSCFLFLFFFSFFFFFFFL
ncbi:beta-catenin family protein 1 [Cystoisospora suis]|uniref:Beta-catenin family protein 1 n=1 Tax=Cystoisospora suis TaxID=483139 RepID=A0A2C6K6L2_9APIC|nr:beta-catenin family protein 1 [Cystoisospora suis]